MQHEGPAYGKAAAAAAETLERKRRGCEGAEDLRLHSGGNALKCVKNGTD